MLLEQLLHDTYNYPHLAAICSTPYEVITDTEDTLIVHSPSMGVHIAECVAPDPADTITFLRALGPVRLETTSLAVYEALRGDYINSYRCRQYVFPPVTDRDPHVAHVRPEDLPRIIEEYGDEAYIRALFDRNRILGYYHEDRLAGYIVHHIDNTLGLLYIHPDYRRRGFAAALVRTAVACYGDPFTYSQVLEDNEASIRMHEALGVPPLPDLICWVYDRDFSYGG